MMRHGTKAYLVRTAWYFHEDEIDEWNEHELKVSKENLITIYPYGTINLKDEERSTDLHF